MIIRILFIAIILSLLTYGVLSNPLLIGNVFLELITDPVIYVPILIVQGLIILLNIVMTIYRRRELE
ncbi:hypothetical protein ACFFIX_19650 [Metabacillus herbersteinensis]|uniref:Uncharacterized protein n=1 Tax=Metabacillus herbersteinensis TaxID=283816 RepID=A0ABV6GJB9_9BACI